MRIDSIITAFTAYTRSTTQNTASASTASEEPSPSPLESIRVSLSAQGQKLLASQKESAAGQDQDIEDSDLPDTIKQSLRQIRALKRQIAEQKAEIQNELSKPTTNEAAADRQEIKLSTLRHQILALTGALVEATNNLGKAMRKSNLTREQSTQVMVLASKEVKVKS